MDDLCAIGRLCLRCARLQARFEWAYFLGVPALVLVEVIRWIMIVVSNGIRAPFEHKFRVLSGLFGIGLSVLILFLLIGLTRLQRSTYRIRSRRTAGP